MLCLRIKSGDVRGLLERLDPHQGSESPQASFNQLYEFKDSGKWLQVMDEDGH